MRFLPDKLVEWSDVIVLLHYRPTKDVTACRSRVSRLCFFGFESSRGRFQALRTDRRRKDPRFAGFYALAVPKSSRSQKVF